jgi:hypothetical protein
MLEWTFTAMPATARATANLCLNTICVIPPARSPIRAWAARNANRLGTTVASGGSLTATDSTTVSRQWQARRPGPGKPNTEVCDTEPNTY